jgi:catechol-2,3-dioxygenase
MKLALTTIILFVQDVDKLKKFYMENLQLNLVEETASEWVLLQAGACQIGLHKVGKEYIVSPEKECKADSNTKIVFEMDGDLAEMRERLIKANITVREVKTFPNYAFWLCDGEDPEGNVFQLKQKKN